MESHELLEMMSQAVEGQLYDYPQKRRVYDVERFAYMLAAFESAKFFTEHMPDADNLVHQDRLLEFAFERAGEQGLILEFGVSEGKTIKVIAKQTEEWIYGFDSFEGLPEDWTHFQKKGRYSQGGQVPQDLPANVKPVVGWFEESLPSFLATHPEPIKFLHVDCDLYSSAKTVLESVASRLIAGSVIVFDEYFNYPGWQHHEHKAFQEFVQQTNLEYRFIGFASSHNSVAVQITRPPQFAKDET